LRILLWDLKSFAKAEAYCDRVAEKTARKWANELSLSTHYHVDHLYGNIYALFVKVGCFLSSASLAELIVMQLFAGGP
jgi:hypothetical protein